jgi:hypothetical protein
MGSRDQPRSVTRDATLDAFGTSQETDDDADEPNETSASEGRADKGTQAVAVTTDWTPAGAPCAACGATVERRWQHQGALVCPDCKDWRER